MSKYVCYSQKKMFFFVLWKKKLSKKYVFIFNKAYIGHHLLVPNVSFL